MKNIIKVFGIIAVGFLTAIIIYPLFHEIGHMIAAYIMGAGIIDVQLFPIPSVLCDVKASSSAVLIIIGFGGTIFPFIVTIFIQPRWFWCWYVVFVIMSISVLSFFVSIVALVGYQMGYPIANEDMTQVMHYVPEYVFQYYFILIMFLGWGIIRIIRIRPIERCLKQFDI